MTCAFLDLEGGVRELVVSIPGGKLTGTFQKGSPANEVRALDSRGGFDCDRDEVSNGGACN